MAKRKVKAKKMNYCDAILHRHDEIEKLAQEYLDRFEFMSNKDIVIRLREIAEELCKKANEDFSKLPAWAADYGILDGDTPFVPTRNGSIFFMLGYSVVSADAHRRNLLEIAEGRETKLLDFPIIPEKEVVAKLAGL